MGRRADRDRCCGARLGIGLHNGPDHCIARLRPDARSFFAWGADQAREPARRDGRHGALARFHATDQFRNLYCLDVVRADGNSRVFGGRLRRQRAGARQSRGHRAFGSGVEMKSVCSSVVGFLLVCTLVFDPLAFTQKKTFAPVDRELTKKEEKWVRQTLARLQLDEKIGQMIAVGAKAVFLNRESEEYKQLRRQIVNNKVGGLILSRSQVWAAAMLTNRLQEMAKVPLLISADLEMGPGMRLDDTTWWAPNMAVAATGETKYARLQGGYTARESRAAGINWLYAPVADVNNNPNNPVINVRSYGEDPQTVGAFVSAF